MKKYCIVTFGCAQNVADSERIAASFENRGYTKVDDWRKADTIVINTCVVRKMAEDRVYGLVRNISQYFGRENLKYETRNSKQIKNSNDKNSKHNGFNNLNLKNSDVVSNFEFRTSNLRDDFELIQRSKRVINVPKIIVTGCLVGMAARDKTGKILTRLKERMPEVDEFLPIEEVGFNLEPVRQSREQGLVVISNGCNNFCTFCVVPFSRGREISRPYEDIIAECKKLREKGYKSVMLLGQNVNSYGADLVAGEKYMAQLARDVNKDTYFENKNTKGNKSLDSRFPWNDMKEDGNDREGRRDDFLCVSDYALRTGIKPTIVKHLGKYRIPTLFPYLLEEVAKLGFEKVDFMSSNPWDFSDELIDVVARNKNITRQIHLPVQSGDDEVLRRMNRWYTAREYFELVKKLKTKVKGLKLTTDIIVGFPGETEQQFQHTLDLCKKIGFEKAYVSIYSSRPMTGATIAMRDDVPHAVKKRRWEKLDKMINHKRKKN